MAEKRMFSQKITRSDAFLAMPTSARLLYYDLSMDADDDGFVDRPKSIMRLTGASDDDLAVLIAKSFVIPFDNGICVIKHWRINNYIRADRYKETNYLELKNKLSVKDNGSYTLKCNSGIPSDNQVTTKWEHRLDKNRLDKSSIYIKVKSDDLNQPIALQNSDVNPSFEEQKCTPTKSKTEKDFEMIWSIYPRKLGKKDAFKYFQQSLKQGTSVEEIKIGVEKYAEYISRNKIEPQFIKHGKTWFYQKCWQDDYSENFATGKSPFTKRVKETPEWLQNYEEKEEKIAEEISEEEAKKILDELKGKKRNE